MLMKKITFVSLLFLLATSTVYAIAPADYAKNFEVDMNEQIPPIEELRKKFAPSPIYDRKFDYYWNIGNKFDKEFSKTISLYGTRGKRLKWENEDILVESVQGLPKEFYPYIGPYLHSLPGMPEKLLNMPGIKETKNKFPERIAPQVADIEDIEFVSPAFYLFLMPEMWQENNDNIEDLKIKSIQPSNRYNHKFADAIKNYVPFADYAPDAKPQVPIESVLRTINPNASSPLTSKDIQAVARSFNDIKEFSGNIHNKALVYEAGSLLDTWENETGKGTAVPMLKDLAHPCQRLVQKLKMQGMEKDFALLVAKQGFNMEEWAYTCDKTIKAYRMLKMSQVELVTIMLYKKNVFSNVLGAFDERIKPSVAMTMQTMVEMYNAPMKDVLEVKKNQIQLQEALENLEYRIVSQPIYLR